MLYKSGERRFRGVRSNTNRQGRSGVKEADASSILWLAISVIQLGDLWDLVIGMRKLVQKPRSRIGREERLCIVITTMGIGGGMWM